MSKIFQLVLMADDMILSNVRVFSDFDTALCVFLKYAIRETRQLLNDESFSDIDSDQESDRSEDVSSCILQVLELVEPDAVEYDVKKEYDVEVFHDFLDAQEDIEGYLINLQISLNEGTVLDDLRGVFAC